MEEEELIDKIELIIESGLYIAMCDSGTRTREVAIKIINLFNAKEENHTEDVKA